MTEPIAHRQLVGENVRSLRKARGWSQKELGEKADLSYKFIGEIERGTVNPSLDSLSGIASALDIEISKLFLNESHIVISGNDLASVRSALSVLTSVMGTT